jgi:hypothetical protein
MSEGSGTLGDGGTLGGSGTLGGGGWTGGAGSVSTSRNTATSSIAVVAVESPPSLRCRVNFLSKQASNLLMVGS